MKKSTRLAGVGGIAIAATALLAGQAQASPGDHSASVFVQTDNLAGNTVVAYDRAGDGSLHQAGVFRTGGKGGALTGAAVDFLASQGSLAYDRANGFCMRSTPAATPSPCSPCTATGSPAAR